MDPFSQAFVGAALAQNFSKKEDIKQASICGALGGMLPDIDILIRSSEDTLLAIEYHRHFTHSLAFIPVGGLVAAFLCMILFRLLGSSCKFKTALIFATLGYATHGLLDACTSYGTHLSLPFSDFRTSWSIISVVDLLYTIPVAVLVILAYRRVDVKYARIFFIFTAIYFSIGLMKNIRITKQMNILAESRGHEIDHYEVKPTIGNNILWRTVYRSGDMIYVDAIRINWLGKTKIYEGESMKAKIFPDDFSYLPEDSRIFYDLKRFNLFSNGLLGESAKHPNLLIDARYSLRANGAAPMWGLKHNLLNPEQRGVFAHFPRDINSESWGEFVAQLMGD